MTTYHHYSSVKIKKLYNIEPGYRIKPLGLWFAEPGLWKQACLEFMGMVFGTNRYLYEITKLPSKILYITDPKDFCKKYGTVLGMNWNKIQEEGYDGVHIPNLSNQSIKTKTGLTGDFDEFLKIPGGLAFFGIDVDSLIIWNTNELEIKLIKYSKKGLI